MSNKYVVVTIDREDYDVCMFVVDTYDEAINKAKELDFGSSGPLSNQSACRIGCYKIYRHQTCGVLIMTRDGYKKHKDLIDKWAAGAEIEFRIDKSCPWIAADVPGWSVNCEYRIAQKPLERWAAVDQDDVIWATFLTEKAVLDSTTMKRPGYRIVHLKEVIDE